MAIVRPDFPGETVDWDDNSYTRQTDDGVVILQTNPARQPADEFRSRSKQCAIVLSQLWNETMSPGEKNTWTTAVPWVKSRRRDFETNLATDWLLFANYHWADVFHGISDDFYLASEDHAHTPIFNPEAIENAGTRWRFTWAVLPQVATDWRYTLYIYQLNPRQTQDHFPTSFFATRLAITLHTWSDIEVGQSFIIDLPWPVAIGEKARVWSRIRSGAAYAAPYWCEQRRLT